jgi:hypothetical protein
MPSREWVATETGIRLATLLAEADLSASDETGELKEPIDDALRMLIYSEEELPTAEPEDAGGFLALVRYTTLLAILERVSDSFDATVGGDAFRLSQVIENIAKMLTRAEADIIARFGSPPGELAGEVGITVLELSYKPREPSGDVIA